MSYCVICLITLSLIAVQGFSIPPVNNDNDAIEEKSIVGEIENRGDKNEPHERHRRMTHMFKKPPPKELSSLEQFCKFMKDWLTTFKFGFSFTSKPFKTL